MVNNPVPIEPMQPPARRSPPHRSPPQQVNQISSHDPNPHASKPSQGTSLSVSGFSEPKLDWNSDLLKIKRMSIICKIYDGFQCPNCEIRFEAVNQEYKDHLDRHYLETQKKKRMVAPKRRWYYSLDVWVKLSSDRNTDQDLAAESGSAPNEETEVPTLPQSIDEQLNRCQVCQEMFDTAIDESGDFILLNAVCHEDVPDARFHPTCLPDYIKNLSSSDVVSKEDDPKASSGLDSSGSDGKTIPIDTNDDDVKPCVKSILDDESENNDDDEKMMLIINTATQLDPDDDSDSGQRKDLKQEDQPESDLVHGHGAGDITSDDDQARFQTSEEDVPMAENDPTEPIIKEEKIRDYGNIKKDEVNEESALCSIM